MNMSAYSPSVKKPTNYDYKCEWDLPKHCDFTQEMA